MTSVVHGWLRNVCLVVCFSIAVLSRSAFADSQVTDKVLQNISYRQGDATLDEYAKQKCQLDILIPAGKTDFPTVIWFHGGGLTNGKKGIPEQLRQQGIGIVTVGYRLSPQVPVTTCIDDAAAATAWVLKNIQNYGGSPDKVFISGNSAGGYLALLVGLNQELVAKYEASPQRLAGIIAVSGQAVTHFTARKEKGIPPLQATIDELAPIYHVRKDAPPILLITGDRELEIYGRYEENAYLARMLKQVGHKHVTLIEIPGTDHGTMVAPSYPHLLEFVKRDFK